MRTNATVVWSAEQGWHDGPRARVSLDERGRLVTEVEDKRDRKVRRERQVRRSLKYSL